MKLRNKKTGEIIEFGEVSVGTYGDNGGNHPYEKFYTLAELNEEWEDYEGPQNFWYINEVGGIVRLKPTTRFDFHGNKEIGNYFSSLKEAEKAVEKLKAWKRLKDKGFRFDGWTIDDGLRISICTNTDEDDIYDEDKRRIKPDLDLLFGGEE